MSSDLGEIYPKDGIIWQRAGGAEGPEKDYVIDEQQTEILHLEQFNWYFDKLLWVAFSNEVLTISINKYN